MTPEYGNALKRICEGEVGRVGGAVGGARVFGLCGRVFDGVIERDVFLCMFVVSAEGGSGRWSILACEKTDARQRKHSPVPK